MSGIRSVLSSTAIVVGAGAALLTGGIAKADPAAPSVPTPNVPGLAVVEQFADPSKAPQMLQAAASILNGTAAAPAAPVTPPPVASASVNLPQQGLPGMPAATPAVPATPAAPATPGIEATLPQLPGMPVPLPQQVSFPGDLASLLPLGAPSMTPAQAAATAATTPSAASPMTAPALASLFPTNALP